MTNSKELFNELVRRVQLNETCDEISSIIYLVLEEKSGLSRMDIMTGKEIEAVILDDYSEILHRINQHEPIQYILGWAEFYGRSFFVNASVLIPRPETELLIRSVLKEKITSPALLDIGTGSGCIAVTLALEIPDSIVYAIDISAKALLMAQRNARNLKAKINFSKFDILSDAVMDQKFDIIVSNPPYVADSERKKMSRNVLDFEPHLALFVSDEDPLIFYRAIAIKGKSLLKPGGRIFVEINERFGREVNQIFAREGYGHLAIERDFDNKDRVFTAQYV